MQNVGGGDHLGENWESYYKRRLAESHRRKARQGWGQTIQKKGLGRSSDDLCFGEAKLGQPRSAAGRCEEDLRQEVPGPCQSVLEALRPRGEREKDALETPIYNKSRLRLKYGIIHIENYPRARTNGKRRRSWSS